MAAKDIFAKKSVVIFTGPDFPTAGGYPPLHFKQGKPVDNTKFPTFVDEILSEATFKTNPEEVWKWVQQYRKLVQLHSPTPLHFNLSDVLISTRRRALSLSIIVEDFTGYQKESYKILDMHEQLSSQEERKEDRTWRSEIYEVLGDLNNMKCSNNGCQSEKLPCPTFDNDESFVPKCTICNSNMKPDILFYEDAKNNAINEILPHMQDMDCLVVLGGSLTSSKVFETLIDLNLGVPEVLIIEAGEEPQIHGTNVKHLISPLSTVIQALTSQINKTLNTTTQKPKLIIPHPLSENEFPPL